VPESVPASVPALVPKFASGRIPEPFPAIAPATDSPRASTGKPAVGVNAGDPDKPVALGIEPFDSLMPLVTMVFRQACPSCWRPEVMRFHLSAEATSTLVIVQEFSTRQWIGDVHQAVGRLNEPHEVSAIGVAILAGGLACQLGNTLKRKACHPRIAAKM